MIRCLKVIPVVAKLYGSFRELLYFISLLKVLKCIKNGIVFIYQKTLDMIVLLSE